MTDTPTTSNPPNDSAPMTRAPSFIRQSLLGRGNLGGQVRNRTSGQVPPVLTLPPGMSIDKLVMSVVDAYRLTMEWPFWQIKDQPEKTRNYAIKLMDKALDFTVEANHRAASDMFSLCVLIYPNYYFDYLLALVRFKLRDYQGCLQIMDRAMESIRARQVLDSELAHLAKEANFAENFYCFYVNILLFNYQRVKAAAMVDFVITNKVIKTPNLLISLVRQYRSTDDKPILAKIAIATVEAIDGVGDEMIRTHLLGEMKLVLSGQ